MPRQGGKKRTKIDLEFERTRRRYDLAKFTLAPAVWLVASWVPLQIAESFSGEDTSLTISMGITISVSVVAGGTLLAMLLKSRRDKEEIKRLEVVKAELEGLLKGVKVEV